MEIKAKQKCALPNYIYCASPSRRYWILWCSDHLQMRQLQLSSISLASQRARIKQEQDSGSVSCLLCLFPWSYTTESLGILLCFLCSFWLCIRLFWVGVHICNMHSSAYWNFQVSSLKWKWRGCGNVGKGNVGVGMLQRLCRSSRLFYRKWHILNTSSQMQEKPSTQRWQESTALQGLNL